MLFTDESISIYDVNITKTSFKDCQVIILYVSLDSLPLIFFEQYVTKPHVNGSKDIEVLTTFHPLMGKTLKIQSHFLKD